MGIRALIDRLFARPESRLLKLVPEHARLCVQAVDILLDALRERIRGNDQRTADLLNQLFAKESEADGLRGRILEEVARGSLPPLSREDFIRLTAKMDLISDWAKEAGRTLEITYFEDLSEGLKGSIRDLAETAQRCAHVLQDVIRSMNRDFKETLSLCQKVEMLEEEVDDKYLSCLNRLYHESLKIDFVRLLFINKFLENLENLTDASEDTADIVKVIIVRGLR